MQEIALVETTQFNSDQTTIILALLRQHLVAKLPKSSLIGTAALATVGQSVSTGKIQPILMLLIYMATTQVLNWVQ